MSARHRPATTNGRTVALPYLSILVVLIVAVSGAIPALAAEGGSRAASQVLFITELALLLIVGRLMGEAALRLGQPSVMGQLIGGLLLGPSFFGLIWPDAQHAIFPSDAAQKSMIDAVSELGILMLLLLTGMETDLQLVRRVGRAAIAAALAGVAVPFACGFALGELLPAEYLPNPAARLVTSIFLGTALAISSVKIVAVVVREMNFMRRDLGQIIVASAILEDTIGWVIIALAFGLAGAGTLDLWTVGRAIVGTGLFMLALVAGILITQSPILTRHIDEQLRGLIVALFMPVFFGIAGLNADLSILRSADMAALAVGLIVIASIGKFVGAFLGGTIGGLSRAESLALGCAMNARGSTEVIVASLGLSSGLLTQNLFTLIVTMAIVTTMAMPPMLRWSLKRLPLRKKERQRLEREELDAKGFVSNLERLLLAIDDSPNGKFAARLAGVIAGSDGKPTTVLDLTGKAKDNERHARHKGAAKREKAKEKGANPDGAEVEDAVKSAAEAAASLEPDRDNGRPAKPDVITRTALDIEAVAGEARKGYDLLVVGIGNTRDPHDGFSKDLSLLTQGFDGPLVVVDSRRRNLASHRHGRILIPVTGTEVSRRGVEIGLNLARATDAQVTALYVTRATSNNSRHTPSRWRVTRRNELAVLRDIAALAERYDVALRSTTRADMAPDQAILHEAARGYDLVVLGVSRRAGDVLFFGNTAAAVLERSPTSNLFVAS